MSVLVGKLKGSEGRGEILYRGFGEGNRGCYGMRILNLLIECDVAPVSIYYFRYGDGTYTLLANVGKFSRM